MGISNTNRVINVTDLRRKAFKADVAMAEKRNAYGKKLQKIFSSQISTGGLILNACDVCKGGMTKKIYEFQRANRAKGTICSSCDKKQRLQELN